MAIFGRNNAVNLSAQLESKGTELRNTQVADAEASKSFIQAAKEAQASSDLAGVHASAVERAVAVLRDAGVEL